MPLPARSKRPCRISTRPAPAQIQAHDLVEEILAQVPLRLHDDNDVARRRVLTNPRIDLPGVLEAAGIRRIAGRFGRRTHGAAPNDPPLGFE